MRPITFCPTTKPKHMITRHQRAYCVLIRLAFVTNGAMAAAELTLLSSIENILAPLWVWLLLGESAPTSTWAGGMMVLAAVALNAGAGARRKTAQR